MTFDPNLIIVAQHSTRNKNESEPRHTFNKSLFKLRPKLSLFYAVH